MFAISQPPSLQVASACDAKRKQSAALPEQRQACGTTSRFDMHFMHVSSLDMQIACPDMTLVMSSGGGSDPEVAEKPENLCFT